MQEKDRRFKRDVAYLKQISEIKEDNFQFILKQMKDMVANYERLKKQLTAVEKKLDQSLEQASIAEAEREEVSIEEEEGEKASITLIKKNKEPVVISLSSMEDYTKLMAQILNGEYNISEEEKEKLLLKVKSHIGDQSATNSADSPSIKPESFETENREEDSVIESESDLKEEQDNSRTKKNPEEKKKSDLSSAKKYFKEQSYEEAISEFQKYRNENPEGEHYPEATFYIGKSFKSLKMPIEAEVFFKEIVKSHPQSLWASRAKKFLKK